MRSQHVTSRTLAAVLNTNKAIADESRALRDLIQGGQAGEVKRRGR
jgi:hypothetical protein